MLIITLQIRFSELYCYDLYFIAEYTEAQRNNLAKIYNLINSKTNIYGIYNQAVRVAIREGYSSCI